VALDAGHDRAGLEDALRASGCRVLITMTGHAGADYLAMLDAIVPGWETRVGGALPDLEHVVVLSTDGRERDWAMTLDALEGIGTANRGATPPAGRTPDDPADLLRLPEPTTVSHDAVQRKAYASASARGFEVGRREVIAGPCLEPPGYVDGLLAVMLAGGAVIFC
jgi:fatty-acyl-CoA synthase